MYTCLSAVLDPLVRCSHPERHCCIAVGVRGSTARRYWSDSVSSWTGDDAVVTFIHAAGPELIRQLTSRAYSVHLKTCLSSFPSDTRRVFSQTQLWSKALSICCCSLPLAPVCPSHQAWGTLLYLASIYAGDIRSTPTECPINVANQHYTHSLLHCTFVASMSDRNHSITTHPERSLPNPHLLNNSAVITGIIHERTPRAPRHFSTKSPRTESNFGRHCIVYGRLVRPRGKAYVQRQRHLGKVSQPTDSQMPPLEPPALHHPRCAAHWRFLVDQRPPHGPVPARFPRTSGRHGRHALHPSVPFPPLPPKHCEMTNYCSLLFDSTL
ncbi:hypothetical protein CCUS01_06858 [Colletotrichum cuscutae]|uniref:Uncharacterized protein n=1 Tax=Colletotrichum cuscutae TaxID=1209917 RepID=A0AAI9UZY6_9PEZI|nr:hypothetical protein CCUS01_06858 [Colletotrichum cuscutae]